MLNNNLLNLFLLLFLSALVYMAIQTDTDTNNLLDKITDIDESTINHIIISQGNKITQFEKSLTTKNWRLTKPLEIDANEYRLQSILALLNAPIHSNYRPDEINLTEIGLSQPSLFVSFNEHRFNFGIINTITGLRYIAYNDRVYTIEDVYSPLLKSGDIALISLYLLSKDHKISKLTLLNQTIKKNEKNVWKSSNDLGGDDISKTISHWQKHQAFSVHNYLKRPSLGTVNIELDDQTTINYQITSIEPSLVLARPELDIEYHLDIESYDILINPHSKPLPGSLP